MSDLISRQDAIKAVTHGALSSATLYGRSDAGITALRETVRAIEALPSVPRKGKWIYGEHDVAMCDGYRCDKCGFFVPWDYQHKSIDFIKDYNYCPSCGADMREMGDSAE